MPDLLLDLLWSSSARMGGQLSKRRAREGVLRPLDGNRRSRAIELLYGLSWPKAAVGSSSVGKGERGTNPLEIGRGGRSHRLQLPSRDRRTAATEQPPPALCIQARGGHPTAPALLKPPGVLQLRDPQRQAGARAPNSLWRELL